LSGYVTSGSTEECAFSSVSSCACDASGRAIGFSVTALGLGLVALYLYISQCTARSACCTEKQAATVAESIPTSPSLS
jgi:hypothetical protein